MSTYTDLHNRAKETLNVDYHTRATPQKVHFMNPENTYHGAFIGEGHLKGANHIVGGIIDHVYLSSAVLEDVKFKNGLVLDTIQQQFDQLSSNLTAEIATRANNDSFIFTSLCNEIDKTNIMLDGEKLERQTADDNLSTDLLRTINFESDQSKARDAGLYNQINSEISGRISADEELEKRVNDKMLHDRHFEMHRIDNREFPLAIHDYAINTYVDSNANAYVYKNGDIAQNPIGRIEKAAYDGNVLTAFEFNAFANHPDTYELTAAGTFQYYFDKNNTVKTTGVGGYRLTWDIAKTTTLNDMQLHLDSANNNGYYDVNFVGTANKAGTLDSNYKVAAGGEISSCTLTITSQQLSNFILAAPFSFTSNGQKLQFTGRNGKQCEITLCSNNTFEMYEQRYAKYYIPVVNEQNAADEFARVYDGNVVLKYDGTLKEVGVDTENGRHFKLNVENGFKQTYDPITPYVKISYSELSNTIKIEEEKKYYRYDFNGGVGNLIPGKYDVPNRRIDDAYQTVGVTLSVSAPRLSAYVNGDYRLDSDGNTNKYQCEKEIELDNFGKIKLTFIKDIRKVFVDVMPNATTDFIHFEFDISSTIPVELNMSRVVKQSKKLCDDIKHARIDEKKLDDKYTSKYVIVPNLLEKKWSGESKNLIGIAKEETKDTLTVLMPDKRKQIPNDYTTASSKFILNFKANAESLQDDSQFVQLVIKSNDSVDKFYYMNREVGKIFIKKNKWTSLQFEELRPHRYIITDLDYSEIDWRLKWLHKELSCHELSSYAAISKLSDDVEFLLSVDRETMNYKGTLPYLSSDPLNGVVRLSAFISQSPHIYGGLLKLGDMFKLSAAQTGQNATIFDKNDISAYLGENDYFVINAHLLSVQDVEWKDLDIFRNSQSEAAALSIELTHQINATSSFISGEVVRISSELSSELNACEISVFNLDTKANEICSSLSSEIEKLSASLSTTAKLSVGELQRQVVSNDNDISTISAYLSNDVMHYKGNVALADQYYDPESHAVLVEEKELFGLLITNPLVSNNRNYKILKGFCYKATSNASRYFDVHSADGKLTLTDNTYIIAINDIEKVEDAKASDFTVINDFEVGQGYLSAETKRLSAELSNEIYSCKLSVDGLSAKSNDIELSVNGLSARTAAICAELSTELCCCELSVNGLSVEVGRISSELSNELQHCELSVNGLSVLAHSISTTVNTLSDELYQTSCYLSGQVDSIWKDIKGAVNYKGHLSTFFNNKARVPENYPYALSDLFAYFYNTHGETAGTIYDEDAEGNFIWKRSIPVNNGWMYCVNVKDATLPESKTYVTKDDISVSNRDYIIIHDHDLSCVELSDITRKTIDIIHTEDDDYVRLEKLREVSAWLENDYSIRVLDLSTALSDEIDKLTLSVDGLSNYVDALEVSANCISTEVVRISASVSSTIARLSCELSAELNACELSVNGLSVRANEICAELSTAISSKIWIKDIGSTKPAYVNGTASDLSIIKINKADYESMITSDNAMLCSNVLFIVSSDYMDAYGQYLSNLIMPTDSVRSIATTKHYVDTIDQNLSNEITSCQLSIDGLQKQIVSNDNDISAVSADLSVVSAHYNAAFTNVFYEKESAGKDLSVDVLNITDGNNTNNKYTMQFLSGTLVLVKNS